MLQTMLSVSMLHTMLSSIDQTMLSPIDQTMLSESSAVPHSVPSAPRCPRTTLAQLAPPQSMLQTMLSAFCIDQTMLSSTIDQTMLSSMDQTMLSAIDQTMFSSIDQTMFSPAE